MMAFSPPPLVGLVEGGSGSGAAAADQLAFQERAQRDPDKVRITDGPAAPLQDVGDDWVEAMGLFLASRRSAGTRRVYRFVLHEFAGFAGKPWAWVRRADVIAYSTELRERGLANATVNSRISAVSSFYKFAQGELELAGRNPAATQAARLRVEAYGRSYYLSAEELRGLLGSIERETAQGKRDYALFLFLLATGRRVSEALRLRWEDFEVVEGRVWYRWQGKGGKAGLAECPGDAWTALVNWRAAQSREIGGKPWVFTALSGKGVHLPNIEEGWRPGVRHLSQSSAAWLLKRYARLAGLRRSIRIHELRHSAAMLRRQAGEDVEEIQRFLAHANLAVTQIYLHQVERRADRSWMIVRELLGLEG